MTSRCAGARLLVLAWKTTLRHLIIAEGGAWRSQLETVKSAVEGQFSRGRVSHSSGL
ncbi:hypothetical protein RHECNPAF_1330073 [Rhizobium etli CNPAF512]|nr:hypothetical protein RHECNPAF_1330073 [Rhizobium etli CNPAF512]